MEGIFFFFLLLFATALMAFTYTGAAAPGTPGHPAANGTHGQPDPIAPPSEPPYMGHRIKDICGSPHAQGIITNLLNTGEMSDTRTEKMNGVMCGRNPGKNPTIRCAHAYDCEYWNQLGGGEFDHMSYWNGDLFNCPVDGKYIEVGCHMD